MTFRLIAGFRIIYLGVYLYAKKKAARPWILHSTAWARSQRSIKYYPVFMLEYKVCKNSGNKL